MPGMMSHTSVRPWRWRQTSRGAQWPLDAKPGTPGTSSRCSTSPLAVPCLCCDRWVLDNYTCTRMYRHVCSRHFDRVQWSITTLVMFTMVISFFIKVVWKSPVIYEYCLNMFRIDNKRYSWELYCVNFRRINAMCYYIEPTTLYQILSEPNIPLIQLVTLYPSRESVAVTVTYNFNLVFMMFFQWSELLSKLFTVHVLCGPCFQL